MALLCQLTVREQNVGGVGDMAKAIELGGDNLKSDAKAQPLKESGDEALGTPAFSRPDLEKLRHEASYGPDAIPISTKDSTEQAVPPEESVNVAAVSTAHQGSDAAKESSDSITDIKLLLEEAQKLLTVPLSAAEYKWFIHEADELKHAEKYKDALKVYESITKSPYKEFCPSEEVWADVLHKIGFCLNMEAEGKKSLDMFRDSLSIRTKVLGEYHKDTIFTLYWTGLALRDLDNFEEAEKVLREASKLRKEVLGLHNVDTLKTLYWFAETLIDTGKYQEAEEVLRECGRARDLVLGLVDVDTLSTWQRLGDAVYLQRRDAEGTLIYKQVLERSRAYFGRNHKDAILDHYCLGRALLKNNLFVQAEKELRDCAKDAEEALGLSHSYTMDTLLKLGEVLEKQKMYEEACQVFDRLVDLLAGLNDADPGTFETGVRALAALHLKGVALYRQGKYPEALKIMEDVYERRRIREQNMPHDISAVDAHFHRSETLFSLHWKGIVLHKQNRLVEAEEVYLQAYRERKAIGEYSEDTLWSLHSLGECYALQGKYEKGEEALRKAYEERKKKCGLNSSETTMSVQWLGFELYAIAKYAEAEAAFMASYQGRKKFLGPRHVDTLFSLQCLGDALFHQGRYADAEAVYLEAYRGRSQVYDVGDADRIQSLHWAARSQYKLGKRAHARATFTKAYNECVVRYGPESTVTAHAQTAMAESDRSYSLSLLIP